MIPADTPERLSVFLHGVHVGYIERRAEGSSFRLSDDYIELGERPILGQVFEDDLDREHRAAQGVPAWFANLLPEGPLRRLIAERAGVSEQRAFFLLGTVGLDLPGAVVVEAEGSPLEVPEDVDPEHADEGSGPMKFSLAGVQLKFSAFRHDRGLTIPVQGFGGDWIVKLPDQRFEGVPENEWSMLEWARLAGLDVPATELVPVERIDGLPQAVRDRGGRALAVTRFDREPEGRIHTEDFNQVLNQRPGAKYEGANYETIARILLSLDRRADVDEFIRRLVFNLVIGNGDAHLKNWSLIYRDRVRPELAPGYDFVSTAAFMPDDRLGLNIGGTKDFNRVTRETFERFASRVTLQPDAVLDVVGETVDRVLTVWRDAADEWPLERSQRSFLDDRLTRLPLIKTIRTS